MLRKTSLVLPLLLLAACSASHSDFHNPFEKQKPFIATAVPADFAIVIDENHDTFYARQHIRQIITAGDAMSTTTYTTRRDYNNTISNQFSQETPLSPVQLQNMWNDVSRNNLLTGSRIWINWLSDADLYRRNTYTVQLRANGEMRSYSFTNGSPGALRPLLLQTDAVRLPITQDSKTPVVSATTEEAPTTEPATTEPLLPPTTEPTTEPSAVVPATIPGMK
jgi:hypothetical protein